jgi:hypothetical protein
VRDFHDFVYHNLLQDVDLPSQAFLKDNFESLLESGYFFFIFDSFDEIPAVLDHDENSWIIAELSNCISSYVLSSRGVIASRLFRQPKLNHRQRTVLEIQPFSDDRIVEAIRIAANEPEKLIRIVLNERSDLGSVARNPFLLHLVIFHFNETGQAPTSQAAMFQTFIDSNVDFAKRTLGIKDHSRQEIYSTCEDISAAMFDKVQGGLEIGELELRNELNVSNLSFVLRFLVSAHIGRIAAVSGAFSFSHRRFNEYFLVRRLQSKRMPIPFDSIQTDSRWRDALVLYAEIADESDANALITHAWSYAAALATISLGSARSDFILGRNALRFIVEGFRNRASIVDPHRAELDKIITDKLEGWATDYIETKTVLEGLGLLSVERTTAVILMTLSYYPGWISEQALTAARYLPSIDTKLAEGIYNHCVERAGFRGFTEALRQANILSVSDAFREVSYMLKCYVAEVSKTWLCALLFVITLTFCHDLPMMVAAAIGVIGGAALILGVKVIRIYKGGKSHFDYTSVLKLLARMTILTITALLFDREIFSRQTTNALSIAAYLFLLATVISIRPQFWSQVQSGLRVAAMSLGKMVDEFSTQAALDAIFRGVKIALGVAAASIASGFIIFLILSAVPQSLIDFIKSWFGTAVLILAALFVLFGCYHTAKGLRSQIVERRSIKRMLKDFRPERHEIAENFRRLRTGWGRLTYVTHLEEITLDHIDAFRRPDNLWPNGIRPQARDEASMKLARLDARWLDLD